MRRYIEIRMLLAVLLVLAPLGALADTTFFSDNFSNGSTLDETNTPASTTTNSASYSYISGKEPLPNPPTIARDDLQFGIVSTSSGTAEIQALFSTNGVALSKVGDYVQVAVVFTNTAGILTANTYLGLGLYDSGGSAPVAGGMLGTMTSSDSDHVTDGVAGWQGYVGQVNNGSSRIMTRAAQTGTGNNNQDLIASGSSSESYHNPSGSGIGSSTAGATLTVGQSYTDVLGIMCVGTNSLGLPSSVAITNTLYDSGNNVVSEADGVATNSQFFSTAFNGLAFGWIERASQTTVVDVASITISGHVTISTNPPTPITGPVSVTAPTNTLVPFQATFSGLNNSYQWKRYGTNLVDGGNISGANTPTLIISPVTSADYASGANGYYCTAANENGSVNSTTASLTQGTAKNLVWNGGTGGSWDLNSNSDWLINGTSTAATFNYGDHVTFNGAGSVYMDSPYLSASTVTVNLVNYSDVFTFGNTSGSISGPGSMQVIGAGELDIANANTYSGGTLISNATALVKLYNLGGLGTGPITLAKAGGMIEATTTGNANTGIAGDVVVADNFTIQFDGNGSYAGVLFGNLSGTAGKTLTLEPLTTGTTNRYRVYGSDMVYDGNLDLDPLSPTVNNAYMDGTVLAPYNKDGSQTYNGVISGPGGVVQRGGLAIFNGQNTYTGGTTPTTGTIGLGCDSQGSVSSGPIGTGPLYLYVEGHDTGSGGIEAYGGARTIANPIEYPTADNNLTLIIGGSNDLTLAGPYTLNGNDGTSTYTNRIIEVDNTALTTISGAISDGGQGFGLEKTGNGTLALDNAETYSGTTTVAAGLLGGTGTIAGPVVVTDGGIAPGNNGIGTLTVNNSVTLGSSSSNVFEVNATGAHDQLNVSGAVTYGGTLYAANLSGTLTTNNSFKLVSAGSETGTFAAIAGSPGPGLTWSFDPTNGVLSVVGSGVATNPTNIVVTVTSGTPPTVNLSWPADHLGWTLQTNSVGLASTTNWFDYPGSTSVTNENIVVDPTKPNVFYRLMYNP